MFVKLQRILLILMLCIVPVQSMASTLGALLCPPSERPEPIIAQQHADPAFVGEHAYDSHTQPGDEAGSHVCCDATVSGMTSVHAVFAPQDFSTHASAVHRQPTLFVPEQPRRPPRA